MANSASFNDLAVLAAQIPSRPLAQDEEEAPTTAAGYWSNPEDATFKVEGDEVNSATPGLKAGSDSEL